MSRLQNIRVVDPVLTNIAHGYANGESVAQFIAPPVPVLFRSGNIIKFDKSHFAVLDTKRAPRTKIQRVSPDYGVEKYNLEQNALAASVSFEEADEARNVDERFRLQSMAVAKTLALLMQSWESQSLALVSDTAQYETSNVIAVAGGDKISAETSDPEALVDAGKEAIRSQCGIYPNSAIIGPDVYNALKRHPQLRDRIKYTSTASIDESLLAAFFGLTRGVRVAKRLRINAAGDLEDMFANKILLFYAPDGPLAQGFLPMENDFNAVPSFAYTYTLDGYPLVGEERRDEDSGEFLNNIILEQQVILTGLGGTGKAGAGCLLTGVVS